MFYVVANGGVISIVTACKQQTFGLLYIAYICSDHYYESAINRTLYTVHEVDNKQSQPVQ